jgi:vancomycin permeability regulator SanA
MDNSWEKLNSVQKLDALSENQHNNIEILICVLAGGLQENGEPHEFVKKRLDKAIELYNNKKSHILVLGGGTYHKAPFLNKDGFIIHESTSCALYLNKNGVNSNLILREWSSYDTIANGFFAFTNYINHLNLKKFTVITSDFHISRSKEIFNYFNKLFNQNKEISYLSIESNLDNDTYIIRTTREEESKINFVKNIVNKINNPIEFIKWFYTEHKAYSSIIKYVENKELNKTY